MRHHIAVRDLPRPLQTALSDAGYGQRDIAVQAAETVHTGGGGGNGRRGGVVAVNLATGEVSPILWGAWGGCNMFGANPVDDGGPLPIPPNGAIVTLTMGGGHPVLATIHVRPETLTPMLPAGPEVSDRDRWILAVFGGLKSFARPEYLSRGGVQDPEIDSLVSRGLLKRNRAGATQITTAGKNARGNADAYQPERCGVTLDW